MCNALSRPTINLQECVFYFARRPNVDIYRHAELRSPQNPILKACVPFKTHCWYSKLWLLNLVLHDRLIKTMCLYIHYLHKISIHNYNQNSRRSTKCQDDLSDILHSNIFKLMLFQKMSRIESAALHLLPVEAPAIALLTFMLR